jgi:membrane protein YdbS with pleckstrin-like domain
MQIWRRPVRLAACLLLALFLMPEAVALGQRFLGWPAFLSCAVAAAVVFLLVLVPPLLAAWVNCRAVHYDFHDDHLSFSENALLREAIRVPYRTVAGLRLSRSALQRRLGLADIVVESRPANSAGLRGVDHVIPDIVAAGREKARIEKIIAAWQASQASSRVPAAAGAAAGGDESR